MRLRFISLQGSERRDGGFDTKRRRSEARNVIWDLVVYSTVFNILLKGM